MPLRADPEDLLHGDLSFHGEDTAYATHLLHPFPAKFPPQLPRLFIRHLTGPGEVVLDPMAGSGTALVEAVLLGRRGIGFDLDPLALRVARAKTTPLPPAEVLEGADAVARRAEDLLVEGRADAFYRTYPEEARRFFEYWFPEGVRRELCALVMALGEVSSPPLRRLLEVALSAAIIAKTGGVSLARDLSHSRPHRDPAKRVRSPLSLFRERARRIARALEALGPAVHPPLIAPADCRRLPLRDASVDLVVTSPPYAGAIDYLRAHKFSLLWLGMTPASLRALRRRSLGTGAGGEEAPLPSARAESALREVAQKDPRRAGALRRYFREMQDALAEMGRVLRPGRFAVLVVGPSRVRGVEVPTPEALADLAEAVGLEAVALRERALDRDRRLLPAGRTGPHEGIQARIHREAVLLLRRPG